MSQLYFLERDLTWWDDPLPKVPTGNAEIFMLGGVQPVEEIYDYLKLAVDAGLTTCVVDKVGAHTIKYEEDIKQFFDVCNLVYDKKLRS